MSPDDVADVLEMLHVLSEETPYETSVREALPLASELTLPQDERDRLGW